MDLPEKSFQNMKLTDGDSTVVGTPKVDASDRLATLEPGSKAENSGELTFASMLYD